jgi:transcriptional regulator with XRE-family HTH domain
MTQEDLAKALGKVSRSSVALWETGRGGETKKLLRIAEVLDVPVEFFVNGMSRQDVAEMISVDERALIRLYRNCGALEKLMLMRSAEQLTRRSKRKSKVQT